MGVGTKAYGPYSKQGRSNRRSRSNGGNRIAPRETIICPFTLEAIEDCTTRNSAPGDLCRFSLEGCMANRYSTRRLLSRSA